MKPVSTLLLAAAFCISSAIANAQTSPVVQTSNTTDQSPYKVALTKLSFGNDQYTKFVLNAWKAYDDNRLDDIGFIISDTVFASFPNGQTVKGKDAFMQGLRAHRGQFASAVSRVTACTTLKSPDNPLNEYTLIWGEELDTKKDGTVQRFSLHEVFVFDKTGKVAQFYQYAIPLPAK